MYNKRKQLISFRQAFGINTRKQKYNEIKPQINFSKVIQNPMVLWVTPWGVNFSGALLKKRNEKFVLGKFSSMVCPVTAENNRTLVELKNSLETKIKPSHSQSFSVYFFACALVYIYFFCLVCQVTFLLFCNYSYCKFNDITIIIFP